MEFEKNRLRDLRREKGISGTILGKELGVSHATISKWENGIKTPSKTNLIKLANFFEVSTDYLLGRTDKPLGDLDGLFDKRDTDNLINSKLELMAKIKDMDQSQLDTIKPIIDILSNKK